MVVVVLAGRCHERERSGRQRPRPDAGARHRARARARSSSWRSSSTRSSRLPSSNQRSCLLERARQLGSRRKHERASALVSPALELLAFRPASRSDGCGRPRRAPPLDVPDGCNPLAADWSCLLPFPSDQFRVEDPGMPSGCRVELTEAARPHHADGAAIDLTALHPADGFSPGSQILAYFPSGVDGSELVVPHGRPRKRPGTRQLERGARRRDRRARTPLRRDRPAPRRGRPIGV